MCRAAIVVIIRNKSHFNFHISRYLIIACRPLKISKRATLILFLSSAKRSNLREMVATMKFYVTASVRRRVVPTSLSYLAAKICNLRFAHCIRVGIWSTCLSITGVIDMGEPRRASYINNVPGVGGGEGGTHMSGSRTRFRLYFLILNVLFNLSRITTTVVIQSNYLTYFLEFALITSIYQ